LMRTVNTMHWCFQYSKLEAWITSPYSARRMVMETLLKTPSRYSRLFRQKSGHYSIINSKYAKWHCLIILWIGHQGEHWVRNKHCECKWTM
jgi:hypothetical protein